MGTLAKREAISHKERKESRFHQPARLLRIAAGRRKGVSGNRSMSGAGSERTERVYESRRETFCQTMLNGFGKKKG